MKRRYFFKSIGVAGLIPIIPKEKLYTFEDVCLFYMNDLVGYNYKKFNDIEHTRKNSFLKGKEYYNGSPRDIKLSSSKDGVHKEYYFKIIDKMNLLYRKVS
jgi:hypothetical protein